jgi:hypothetical protein
MFLTTYEKKYIKAHPLIKQLDSGYVFGKDEHGFYVRKTIDAKERLEVVGFEEDYTKRAAFGHKRDFIWKL